MAATTNLFITGFPTGTDEAKIQAVFGQYGTVTAVKVLAPREDKPDVAAIVSMTEPEKAKWLIDNVSGKIPQGLAGPVEIKMKREGKGWGKGYGIPPWAWAWMKGKGKGKGGGLRSFPAEQKVWVGGLPEDGSVTFQQVLDHFKPCGNAKFAAVMKGSGAGQAGVVFETAEEATAAIQKMNGTVLGGKTIQTDVWTKKEKTDAPTA